MNFPILSLYLFESHFHFLYLQLKTLNLLLWPHGISWLWRVKPLENKILNSKFFEFTFSMNKILEFLLNVAWCMVRDTYSNIIYSWVANYLAVVLLSCSLSLLPATSNSSTFMSRSISSGPISFLSMCSSSPSLFVSLFRLLEIGSACCNF